MIVALSSKAMRMADELAVTRARIPSIELMEAAGIGLMEELHAALGSVRGKRFAVLCGSGNNGGDGFVVARLLVEHNCSVRVLTVGRSVRTPDAATNFRRLEKLGARYPELLTIDPYKPDDPIVMQDDNGPDVIIDAILGTGLTSSLRSPAIDAVNAINDGDSLTVSVDIPTGLDADSGAVLGSAVRADITVTMAAVKNGLFLGEGPSHCGNVRVVDIGIPQDLLNESGKQHGCVRMMEPADLFKRLPSRTHDDHKYSVGLVGIVGASTGLTGAVVMSARAAYRSGAGAVVCAVPASVEPVVAGKLVETMTIPLPEDANGLTADAVDVVKERFTRAQCVLIGPGLGRGSGSTGVVLKLLSTFDTTCVIDADGLNAVSSAGPVSKPAGASWIMTPHAGEFDRLSDVPGSRIERCVHYARLRESVVVLKGSPTIVASPDGEVFLSPNTTHAFATAGTGDVLSGLIAGFCAQGLNPVDAALCALMSGELAARRYCRDRSFLSMVATDIIDEIPYVLRSDSID